MLQEWGGGAASRSIFCQSGRFVTSSTSCTCSCCASCTSSGVPRFARLRSTDSRDSCSWLRKGEEGRGREEDKNVQLHALSLSVSLSPSAFLLPLVGIDAGAPLLRVAPSLHPGELFPCSCSCTHSSSCAAESAVHLLPLRVCVSLFLPCFSFSCSRSRFFFLILKSIPSN